MNNLAARTVLRRSAALKMHCSQAPRPSGGDESGRALTFGWLGEEVGSVGAAPRFHLRTASQIIGPVAHIAPPHLAACPERDAHLVRMLVAVPGEVRPGDHGLAQITGLRPVIEPVPPYRVPGHGVEAVRLGGAPGGLGAKSGGLPA